MNPLEHALEPRSPAFRPSARGMRFQKAAGQHWNQRERHHRGHHHRDAHHDRELMEQQPDHARHEKNRNEHRHQRYRNRDDRETHFARALQRGLHRWHAVFDVTHDVLQHHDRVIDHQPHRERNRQQRNIVEAVAQPKHDGECADQGNRQRQRRDDRRHHVPQENEYHQHHQRHGEAHGEFDIVNRIANRLRTIVTQFDLDRRRQLLRETGHHRFDGVDRGHGVGVRLAPNRHRDRTLTIGPTRRFDRFHTVLHQRDVAKAHWASGGRGDDQIGKFGGARELAVGGDDERLTRTFERTHRRVRVSLPHGGRDIVERESARGSGLGIDTQADRKFLLTIDVHLCHTRQSRERRHDQIFGVTVQFGQCHGRRNQRQKDNG